MRHFEVEVGYVGKCVYIVSAETEADAAHRANELFSTNRGDLALVSDHQSRLETRVVGESVFDERRRRNEARVSDQLAVLSKIEAMSDEELVSLCNDAAAAAAKDNDVSLSRLFSFLGRRLHRGRDDGLKQLIAAVESPDKVIS